MIPAHGSGPTSFSGLIEEMDNVMARGCQRAKGAAIHQPTGNALGFVPQQTFPALKGRRSVATRRQRAVHLQVIPTRPKRFFLNHTSKR
jgi:hypothetical protein